MDSLFHFVFASMGCLAIGIHKKHKLKTVFALALASVAIDVDHFFGLVPRATFHNIFVVFLFPLILFLFFFYYENKWFNHKKKKSIKLQTYSLLLLIVLASHVVDDTFYYEPMQLLYPISNQQFAMPPLEVTINQMFPQLSPYTPAPWAKIITRDGIALTFYAAIILLGAFVEDFIYLFERKHESTKKAIKDALKDFV